ncbi:MAG: phytanoyl-CoA dioxygenase family protein [Pseudomonadota bacterium]
MINQAQVDQFRAQGYLVVEDLLDPGSLAAVRSEYETMMDGLYAGWQRAGRVPAADGLGFFDKLDLAVHAGVEWYQPCDISLPHNDIAADTPMHIGPAVFDMVTHQRVLDTVEALIGPEISSNPIQHVRIKPPQREVSGDETRAHIVQTDWHQDQGVTLEEADATEFITVWLAITDATEDNGCLQVAHGGEDRLLPHCPQNGQVGLPADFRPTDTAKPLPVKAGGAVIFHPLTPHASLVNRSQNYRWSFDLRYHVTGQPSGRPQFPSFVARSRARPQSELRDWREWQRMWDMTRAHLAATPHQDQHRWPADAAYCA